MVVARDLGRALGYGDKGLVKSIAEWAEFYAGRDFDVIEGEDLRQFKAQMRLVPGSGTNRAANLTILYETGMDLACQKAQTEAGAHLRRYLAEFGQPLARGGQGAPVGKPVAGACPCGERADGSCRMRPRRRPDGPARRPGIGKTARHCPCASTRWARGRWAPRRSVVALDVVAIVRQLAAVLAIEGAAILRSSVSHGPHTWSSMR